MKRILLCLLVGAISLSNVRMTPLTEEAEKLKGAESRRQNRLKQRKEKVEKEVTKLYENYNKRAEMTEKLRMDSEVSWYRDEYRGILKNYDAVQKGLREEISKKEKELSLLNIGLGMEE